MKRMLLLAAAVGLWPTAAALAQAPAAKPDLARAQTIVSQVCAACHGADGNSVIPTNPSLAGMPAEYITRQLGHFKTGVRANPIMLGMAATLSDDDMKALGVYFSQQKPKGLVAKNIDLVKSGQHIYRGGIMGAGVPACAACHLPTGAGLASRYPRLAGQHPDYTYAQLKSFRAGERGADAAGKDVNGRIMATIAAKLSDAEMKAVAEYVSALTGAP